MLRGGGLAALFFLGTACGPAFDPADAALAAGFDPAELPPLERGAHRRLSETDWYGSTIAVWTWSPTQPTFDVCRLIEAGHRDALIHLAREAAPGGVLWALRGLQVLDPPAFEALAAELRGDPRLIELAHGCFGSTSTVGEVIETEVRGDQALAREVEDLHHDEADLDWLAGCREHVTLDRARFGLREEDTRAAFEHLLAAQSFGDASSELFRQYNHLLEFETDEFYAAIALLDEGTPAARLWGAAILAKTRRPLYDALRPELAATPSAITCDHGDRTVEHTAAEAIALHIDPPR